MDLFSSFPRQTKYFLLIKICLTVFCIIKDKNWLKILNFTIFFGQLVWLAAGIFELLKILRCKLNVMPLIRRGSNLYFFAALYCSCLGFNALLASPRYEGLQKGIYFGHTRHKKSSTQIYAIVPKHVNYYWIDPNVKYDNEMH